MRAKLIILAAALLAAGLFHWLMRPRVDPLDGFPHAFIAQPSYDPGSVVTIVAPLSQPPAPPSGMLPVWRCDDPAFTDAAGRPWLIPVATQDGPPAMPRHPVLGRSPALTKCRRYQTDEGVLLLSEFQGAKP
jgi:hypothetical protein